MICGYFKPKFYKKCKHLIKFIKIRLNIQRKKKNAMVSFLKTDIVEILKTGQEDDERAYIKVEELLEYRQMIASYDLIERCCDCISSNLPLMLNQRECPEECREAVYSLIYAAAWVRKVPELKDLRALFTRRYGDSIDAYINQELVEKLVWRKPSREFKVQTLQEIAQEAKISWDSLSKGSLSSSSSLSSKRRESVKKIFPYKKQGAQNDEQGHDEKKDESTVQEKSRLRGPPRQCESHKHKHKSTTSYMKIRLDIVRKKRIAMVNFLEMDIVDFLKNGLEYNAYTRAEMLLEELRIISCYDIIERFCDSISENLSLMLKKRECPEECKEAVSSLIHAAAWVPDVPELKDLRAVFTKRFGSFIHSSVNHEVGLLILINLLFALHCQYLVFLEILQLVEKTELRSRPSRELKIQTVKDIAKEFSIDWDPTALNLFLLGQTSSSQIDDKVETGTDDSKIREEKSIVNDQSENESVLSESWTRDSLSKGSLSSSSSSSLSSPRRDSEKKKILPYGLISPPRTKPGGRNN
ncbi:unnamed protein product [Brassica rapa subsp. narinosa]